MKSKPKCLNCGEKVGGDGLAVRPSPKDAPKWWLHACDRGCFGAWVEGGSRDAAPIPNPAANGRGASPMPRALRPII